MADRVPSPQATVTALGQQPAHMRSRNASAVLQAIVARGPISRGEIAAATGLSAVTVTRVVGTFLATGILMELTPVAADMGRRRVPLQVVRDDFGVVGVHIGLRRTSLGLVDLTGSLVARIELDHTGTSPEEILTQAVDAIPAFIQRVGRSGSPLGVGVAIGGWVQPQTGTVLWHQALGWKDVPVQEVIAQGVGLPTWVENDVRTMALAEIWMGAGADVRSLIYIFVGNVVGTGIIIDRKLHVGPRSAAGGMASLEAVGSTGNRTASYRPLSDVAVLERARQSGVEDAASLDALVKLARDGDRKVHTLLRARAQRIGNMAAVLVDLLDPEVVVLGGSGVLAAPEYLPTVREEALRRAPMPFDVQRVLVPTALGEAGLVIAPATLVLESLYEQPLESLATIGRVGGAER